MNYSALARRARSRSLYQTLAPYAGRAISFARRYGALQSNRNRANRTMLRARMRGHMRMSRYRRKPTGSMGRRVVTHPRNRRSVLYTLFGTESVPHRTMRSTTIKVPTRQNDGVSDDIFRLGDNLFIAGVRFHLRFINDNATQDVLMHYGFLQSTGHVDAADRTNTGVNTDYVKEFFFTDHNSNGEKQIDFTDDTAANDMLYDQRRINSQKWRVLSNKTMLIPKQGDDTRLNVRRVNKYMKINKKFAFMNGLDQISSTPIIFFCWWQFANGDAGTPSVPITMELKTIPFFGT